jgi:monovalent cation:H+ antiporter-2, CPA2 family
MSSRLRTDIDVTRAVTLTPTEGTCRHVAALQAVRPGAQGCEDCLKIGAAWVHLRLCMTCGHVGCCDSSPNRHATQHYHATSHPIVRSLERGEDWGWCYEDEVLL